MKKPNVIVMLMDNLGYGDLQCYGCDHHRTPHIDQLAREGMRFTSFYSTSGVCTPSRASLMTGCYPRRINMHIGGRGHAVLMPVDPNGLHPDELTIARLLKDLGYATACIGKWHLGDQIPFLPTRHGFDFFFGCPYSDDMVPNAAHPNRPPLPLMRNELVIESMPDRKYLTKRYTEECLNFIRANKDRPFFIYLPHAMPGSTDRPFASPEFAGKSANGSYGDAVEELDWSCGEIMKTLAALGLDQNTLVIWTSDNGAVKWDPPQGSNAPLKGWGYDTSEGAQRVPCLMRWPGRIPAGSVTDKVATMMDILPTAILLAGGRPPADRIIDGRDIRPIIFGEAQPVSSYDATGFFYYHVRQLQAVRAGPWKLYLALENKATVLYGNNKKNIKTKAALYNLDEDISEANNVASDHPDVIKRLETMAEKARQDLGDMGREGANQRPAGQVEKPTPRLLPTQ